MQFIDHCITFEITFHHQVTQLIYIIKQYRLCMSVVVIETLWSNYQ
jgi:hypothetical protein